MRPAADEKAAGGEPAAFGDDTQPANVDATAHYAGVQELAARLANPLFGGTRPHLLIAWEADDADTTRAIAALMPNRHAAEVVHALAAAPVRFCVWWGRIARAHSGALHFGAPDEATLRLALACIMAEAERTGATTTCACLFLPPALRDSCAALLGELSAAWGQA